VLQLAVLTVTMTAHVAKIELIVQQLINAQVTLMLLVFVNLAG
jgi:hypothetical protein